MKKSVWLVLALCDDEYFCRDVAFVGSTEEKAKEWINEAGGGNRTVTGWDDTKRDYYVIEEWRVDD